MISVVRWFVIAVFCLFCFSGCGGAVGEDDTMGQGPCVGCFQSDLVFPDDIPKEEDGAEVNALGIDCAAVGVSKVQYSFFSPTDELLKNYEADCSQARSEVSDVRCHDSARVEIFLSNDQGKNVLFGRADEFEISRDQYTVVSPITMEWCEGQVIADPVSETQDQENAEDVTQDQDNLEQDQENVEDSFFISELDMRFVRIHAGEYDMGSPATEIGRDTDEAYHKVRITRDFYMQTTEVTQAQWIIVMKENHNPSNFRECGMNCPIDSVSYNLIVEQFLPIFNEVYAGRNHCRLPTEAEWEYAARAGSQSRFYFGDSEEALPEYAWFRDNSDRMPHPVAQKRPNAWGLYDMYGNLREWCQDWYGSYTVNSLDGVAIDPQGPENGERRVLRGGGWFNLAEVCRSANRYNNNPLDSNSIWGFRLVCTPAVN